MSRSRGFLSCAFPALSTVLLAQGGERSALGEARGPGDIGSERDIPALFSWADFDGDGRLDLAAVGHEGTLQLLANAGDGRFEDVTERAGLAGVGNAALALWADYDGDGRLDLFVGAREGASRLFHNDGGTFTDMSAGSGLASEGAVQSAQWLDHDGDGRLDLFVASAERNQIFHGLEGGFFERAELPLSGVVPAPGRGGSLHGATGVETRGEGAGGVGTPAVPVPTHEVGEGGRRSMQGNARSSGVSSLGRPTILGPTPGAPVPIPLVPAATCVFTLRDAITVNPCISASTTPTLGMLHPLSTNLNVSGAGNVGIGTTSPSAKLEVAGTARVTNTLTLAPAGDTALDVSTGSIYKGGTLFIHTKGGSNNTALGQQALANATSGSYNTASGDSALLSNTTGAFNTASGADALRYNTGGSRNTASGSFALRSNTTGNDNTASGEFALSSNTTGSNNTASGTFALEGNTTGLNNTASGTFALALNMTGLNNTACGEAALQFNTTGSRNTASGAGALRYNTTSYDNTASGFNALHRNTTGGNNTASGARALYSNTTGGNNTASGSSALRYNTTGGNNTASGFYALHWNTTGGNNTASGSRALFGNTYGYDNTASGTDALRYNTTGFRNTASGAYALRSNTTGHRNVASGQSALRSNTTGFYNSACGQSALYSNTIGYLNTACGGSTLPSNTTGARNTASGAGALTFNTTGSLNTASGQAALLYNTTGNRNIAVGQGAGAYLTTGSDNIAIGNVGVAAEAATIRIGTAGTHTRAFVAGIRGVTTGVADAIPVLVDSAGQLGTVSSSRRFKEEIRDMGDRTERLLQLRPVVFRYKPEVQSGERPLEYGLIAEEVAEVFPELVVYDEEGKPFTVKYHLLSAMLLNELKETDERVEAQARELEELEAAQAEGLMELEAAHARQLEELRSELEARFGALESRATPAGQASGG